MTQMRVKRELNVSSKYQFFSSQCFDAYPLKPKLIPDMISVMKIAKTLNLWYYLLGNKRFQSWLFFIKATCTEYSGSTLKKFQNELWHLWLFKRCSWSVCCGAFCSNAIFKSSCFATQSHPFWHKDLSLWIFYPP